MEDAALDGVRDPALDEVRQHYLDGDLVLFVGAGVSAAAGLPSWPKLVELVAARAKARGADVDEVQRLLDGEHFIDALSAAVDGAGQTELTAVVKSALDDRRLVPEVPEIAKAIASLEPKLRAVLTTNLDHLLERAFQGRWPAFYRATSGVVQERGIILKVHGTLLDPRTWVLTRDQYDRAMYNDPLLTDAVAAVFRAHTVLFVGYGLADDDFDQVLARMRALSGDAPPPPLRPRAGGACDEVLAQGARASWGMRHPLYGVHGGTLHPAMAGDRRRGSSDPGTRSGPEAGGVRFRIAPTACGLPLAPPAPRSAIRPALLCSSPRSGEACAG
jgi:hypothetical protein